MTGASKIPPHIARELGRHLKPRSKGPGGSSAGKGQKDTGKLYTFLGCTAFIGITASFPYVGMAWIGRLTDKDEVRLSMNYDGFFILLEAIAMFLYVSLIAIKPDTIGRN